MLINLLYFKYGDIDFDGLHYDNDDYCIQDVTIKGEVRWNLFVCRASVDLRKYLHYVCESNLKLSLIFHQINMKIICSLHDRNFSIDRDNFCLLVHRTTQKFNTRKDSDLLLDITVAVGNCHAVSHASMAPVCVNFLACYFVRWTRFPVALDECACN
jgi:hypothetical protein